MKKTILFLGLAIMACGFLACTSTNELLDIEGNWNTQELVVEEKVFPLCDSSITIEKSENKNYELNGNSGVNIFFGSAKVKGQSFKVLNNLGSTRMLGDSESMEFEKAFTEVLIDARIIKRYSEGEKEFLLLQTKNGKKKIIFARVE